ARAGAACRSIPPTACTARPATSRTRTRSSPGPRRKAAPARTTRTCELQAGGPVQPACPAPHSPPVSAPSHPDPGTATVAQLYRHECERLGYHSDPVQLRIVALLDELRDRLIAPPARSGGLLRNLFSRPQ